jgi:hypothetical protein
MLDHRHFGLLVYSVPHERAIDQLNELFRDPGFDDAFRLLPESALGTGLSFPDGCGRICRRIFLYTAAMAVSPAEVTAEEMRKVHSEEVRERFW